MFQTLSWLLFKHTILEFTQAFQCLERKKSDLIKFKWLDVVLVLIFKSQLPLKLQTLSQLFCENKSQKHFVRSFIQKNK